MLRNNKFKTKKSIDNEYAFKYFKSNLFLLHYIGLPFSYKCADECIKCI